MRLLVVGGSGFIGRNVIERLAAGGHPFERVTATYCGDADFAAWAEARGAEPLRLDLRGSVTLPRAFDVAIYTAGNANHATAAEQPLADAELNSGAMLRFLESFRGRLVYLSSGAVYYGLSGAVHPGVRVQPTFAYGISKYASELYAGAARARGRLASFTALRLFYAFGRHDKPRRLVPRVLEAAARTPDAAFRVHGNGASLVDPLDAAFVADVLLRSAARAELEGVFDLCAGAPRTVVEFAREVARSAGSGLSIEASGEREEFPVTFFGSPQPLFDALGIPAAPPLTDALARARAWRADCAGAGGS